MADRIDVTTEEALAALAHPMRMRLVGLLRLEGPATASSLASVLGVNSGATSYHLRRLAAAGFIEEAPELGNRRERWWRASARETSWSSADFLDSPGGRKADLALRTEILRWQQTALHQWMADEPSWDPAWVDAAASGDAAFMMSLDELRAFKNDIAALHAEYASPPPDGVERQRVMFFFHAFPIEDLPL